MQYILTINQVKALEWGLNAQQAMVFAVVYNAPSWAEEVIVGGKVFYKLSKAKIVSEVPILTDKPDTAYRILKALELVEVIELSSTSVITLVRLTEKGKTWNTSDKFPSRVGKKSEVGSEKNPTDQVTSNQGTKDQELFRDQQAERIPYAAIFEAYATELPTLPQLKVKDEARRKAVRSICKMDERFQKPEAWHKYFRYVKASTFLMGMNAIGFDWLLKPANFKKVIEGNYHEVPKHG